MDRAGAVARPRRAVLRARSAATCAPAPVARPDAPGRRPRRALFRQVPRDPARSRGAEGDVPTRRPPTSRDSPPCRAIRRRRPHPLRPPALTQRDGRNLPPVAANVDARTRRKLAAARQSRTRRGVRSRTRRSTPSGDAMPGALPGRRERLPLPAMTAASPSPARAFVTPFRPGVVDLPGFRGGRSVRFPSVSRAGDGALEADRRMSADGIVKLVDVAGDGRRGVPVRDEGVQLPRDAEPRKRHARNQRRRSRVQSSTTAGARNRRPAVRLEHAGDPLAAEPAPRHRPVPSFGPDSSSDRRGERGSRRHLEMHPSASA